MTRKTTYLIMAVLCGIMAILTLPEAKAQQQSQNVQLQAAKIFVDQLPADVKSKLVQDMVEQSPMTAYLSNAADIGRSIGIGVGEAAKGLGVAANEFMDTRGGIIVTGIIAIKLVGPFVVKTMGGVFILMMGLGMVVFMVRRSQTLNVKYHPEHRNWFGNYVKTEVLRDELSGDFAVGYTIAALIVIAISGAILATI